MYIKKLNMEENNGEQYKKVIMEQGTVNNDTDYVHELKQSAAKNTMIFANSFISMLRWTIVIGIVLITIVILKIIF